MYCLLRPWRKWHPPCGRRPSAGSDRNRPGAPRISGPEERQALAGSSGAYRPRWETRMNRRFVRWLSSAVAITSLAWATGCSDDDDGTGSDDANGPVKLTLAASG